MNFEIGLISGLGLIMGILFLLPLFSKQIEEKLETFIFLMGVLAVSLCGLWSWDLVLQILKDPLPIALIVLSAGFVFGLIQNQLKKWMKRIIQTLGPGLSLFILIGALGILSSCLTLIIAPLILAEALRAFHLSRETQVKIAIIASLAIALGSALTPWGGPFTTILIVRLNGGPCHADSFFLIRLLGPWIVASIVGLSLWAALLGKFQDKPASPFPLQTSESIQIALKRSIQIYIFVAGLVLLGTGFSPIANRYFTHLSPSSLYWTNLSSAALDNASMAAAEINPWMPLKTLEYILVALLISGVMLIPGNLSNIILAHKLDIKSREWASFAIPLGLGLLLFSFLILKILPG